MHRYAQRLSSVARALGCPVHGERLRCDACEWQEPLPTHLATGMASLIQAITARVGREGIRAAHGRVSPLPNPGPCGRCGGPRHCVSCQVRYTKAMFREIALSDEEQSTLEALLAACRAIDQRRAAERGG